MKTININIPLNGHITRYELQRAICNKLEQRQPFKPYVIPKLNYPKSSIKKSAGLKNFVLAEIYKIMP